MVPNKDFTRQSNSETRDIPNGTFLKTISTNTYDPFGVDDIVPVFSQPTPVPLGFARQKQNRKPYILLNGLWQIPAWALTFQNHTINIHDGIVSYFQRYKIHPFEYKMFVFLWHTTTRCPMRYFLGDALVNIRYDPSGVDSFVPVFYINIGTLRVPFLII
jgi:hypothetical protein